MISEIEELLVASILLAVKPENISELRQVNLDILKPLCWLTSFRLC